MNRLLVLGVEYTQSDMKVHLVNNTSYGLVLDVHVTSYLTLVVHVSLFQINISLSVLLKDTGRLKYIKFMFVVEFS